MVEYDASKVGKTEQGVAKQVAMGSIGFTPLQKEEVLDFSYDINNNFAVAAEPNGQLVQIGKIGDVPVFVLRIDREDYFDEQEQKEKYRKQPGTKEIIEIIDKAFEGQETPVALVTSGTYQTSREVDTTRAALNTNRIVGVSTYGTLRLADAKNESAPEPAHINQLPGELHKIAQQVAKLEATLTANK
jgi:hypothetical protein